jgi:hypothetical protein
MEELRQKLALRADAASTVAFQMRDGASNHCRLTSAPSLILQIAPSAAIQALLRKRVWGVDAASTIAFQM